MNLVRNSIIIIVLAGLFYSGLAISCLLGIWPSKTLVFIGTVAIIGAFMVCLFIFGIEARKGLNKDQVKTNT